MRKRFDKLIEETSCFCNDEVSNMVEDVLSEDMKALPTNDPKRIFWEQQVCNFVITGHISLYMHMVCTCIHIRII